MIRRLKYDDIEKSDDRHDDECEEKCDLGTGSEEHDSESIEFLVFRVEFYISVASVIPAYAGIQ
jgi:hypothetical protein